MKRIINPWTSYPGYNCFGCSPDNPIGTQMRFFEDGDEASLKPMILKDIAEKTGLDISTVSRVSNSKYVQTRWGIFPLRFFFNDAYTTA